MPIVVSILLVFIESYSAENILENRKTCCDYVKLFLRTKRALLTTVGHHRKFASIGPAPLERNLIELKALWYFAIAEASMRTNDQCVSRWYGHMEYLITVVYGIECTECN